MLTSSGTTSAPKIIPLNHQILTRLGRVAQRLLHLTPEDRSLSVRPLHYAGALTITRDVMFSGGSIVYIRDMTGKAFLGHLSKFLPSWYSAGPIYQRRILEEVRKRPNFEPNRELRFITLPSGGLRRDEVTELEAAMGVPVLASYNMSECSRVALEPYPPGLRKPGTVGVAVDCEIAIRAEDGTLLSAGQAGEVVVKSPHMFAGYESDPTLNQEAFVDGWFRTGDEGFFDRDGYLTVSGRIKEVISRGGEKISPAEVDDVLQTFPGIRDAGTFAWPHPTLGELPVAAVVFEAGARVSDRKLKDFLSRRLATFKIPLKFIPVDAIPKGPAGKVLRRRLAELYGPDAGR